MVRIRVFGVEATIDYYEWQSEDKHVEAMLNRLLSPLGPSGSDPDPPYTAAKKAIEFFRDGEIIYADPPKKMGL